MATPKSSKPQFTEADGRQLAVDMLREIGDWWFNVSESMSEAQGEKDAMVPFLRRDPRILRRYIRTVEAKRSAALSRGFFTVVTEYIGGAIHGAPSDIDSAYEPSGGGSHAAT